MRGKFFTEFEDQEISNLYKTHTDAQIARKLNRTEGSISTRRLRLGFEKGVKHSPRTYNRIFIRGHSALIGKTQPYWTEEEMLSSPFYNPKDLIGEERAMYRNLIKHA